MGAPPLPLVSGGAPSSGGPWQALRGAVLLLTLAALVSVLCAGAVLERLPSWVRTHEATRLTALPGLVHRASLSLAKAGHLDEVSLLSLAVVDEERLERASAEQVGEERGSGFGEGDIVGSSGPTSELEEGEAESESEAEAESDSDSDSERERERERERESEVATEGGPGAAARAGGEDGPGRGAGAWPPVRVAVYSGGGASSRSINNIVSVLRKCFPGQVKPTRIKPINSALRRSLYDVLLIPGGSAGGMVNYHVKNSLFMTKYVKRFLLDGGGYVGICAGAYLGAMDGMCLTKFNYREKMKGGGNAVGQATVRAAAPSGGEPESESFPEPVFYMNGPIFEGRPTPPHMLKRCTEPVSSPRVLMRAGAINVAFSKEPGDRKTSHRVHLAGRALVVANEYGPGRVVLSSVHPETRFLPQDQKNPLPSACDSDNAALLLDMVLHAAGRPTARWQPQQGRAPLAPRPAAPRGAAAELDSGAGGAGDDDDDDAFTGQAASGEDDRPDHGNPE